MGSNVKNKKQQAMPKSEAESVVSLILLPDNSGFQCKYSYENDIKKIKINNKTRMVGEVNL